MDELVARIVAGDDEAFAELVRSQYDRLFDFAFSYTKSPAAAEDVVQEVLLNVWERRSKLNPKHSISAYLFGAVRNRALNHLRSSQRTVALTGGAEFRTDPKHASTQLPDADLGLKELLRDYRAAVAELPERRRQVFLLSRLYGLTYEEIAGVMDISINTVRTQMSAALDHLRNRLADFL